MKAITNKTIGLITLIVIALLCVPLMWFTLGNDSGTSTGWQLSPRVSDDGEISSEYVILKVTYQQDEKGKTLPINAIYVNIGEVYGANEQGEITFTLDFNNSETSLINGLIVSNTHREFTVFKNGERNYGWVNLAGSLSYSQKYIKITSKQSFELKEVVVTDEKGNRLQLECYGGAVWGETYDFLTAEQNPEAPFTKVVDEQDSFDLKGISTLTYKEAETLGAISNLLKGEGYHVANYSNVLGVELTAVGVLIFGENSFGLRIIPFLFFVATLYLLFFFGKKLFGGSLYGTLCSACYLLAGLGLCFGGLGLSYSIAVFFAVLTLWFTYNLFTKGITAGDNRTWLREALMSSLFLTLAILCDICALILLPLVFTVYIVLAVKAIKNAVGDYKTASGLDKEYARESKNKVIVSTVLGFVVLYLALPLLLNLMFYLVAFPTYAGYYATENIFKIIAQNFANLYSSLSVGTFFPWVVGLGSQTLEGFGGNSYIVANKAFSMLSTLSVVALALLYQAVKKQKITSGGIIVGIKDNQNAILFNIYAFALCYLANLIFVGKNEYYSYIYTLIPATLSVIALFKVCENQFKNKLFKGIAIAVASVVGLFFLAQAVTFLQFFIPSDIAQYLYGWML